MSRSQPTAKNPATRFFRWAGGSEKIVERKIVGGKEVTEEKYIGGKVQYYDKENGVNVEMELPFTFLVLDQLTTITGFNESQQQGYWSNEVKFNDAELVVRTKKGVQGRGTYQEIKALNLSGLKYAKSVYVAYKDDQGELALGNIQIAGSALNAFIEFSKKFDVEKCAVMITDRKLAKKGSNYYFEPVFEGRNVNEQTEKAAAALDEQLQKYFEGYLKRAPDYSNPVATDDEDEPQADEEDETVDDAPQSAKAAQKAPAKATAPPADDEEDDEPSNNKIDLKDVPF